MSVCTATGAQACTSQLRDRWPLLSVERYNLSGCIFKQILHILLTIAIVSVGLTKVLSSLEDIDISMPCRGVQQPGLHLKNYFNNAQELASCTPCM